MISKMELKESLMKISGFWFCKRKNIPVGADHFNDLKYKLRMSLNTVFDVGANIGQTASLFNHYFKESIVYSFEPISSTYHQLIANTKHLNRVKCFQMALGDKIDSIDVDLFEGDDSTLNSLRKEAMNKNANLKETIRVQTGDAFCKEHQISAIDLLKIDTEGYELEVLRGFGEMIGASRIKAIYCEAGFNFKDPRHTFIDNLMDFALANNFRFYGLYEVNNLKVKEGANFGNLLFVNNSVIDALTP